VIWRVCYNGMFSVYQHFKVVYRTKSMYIVLFHASLPRLQLFDLHIFRARNADVVSLCTTLCACSFLRSVKQICAYPVTSIFLSVFCHSYSGKACLCSVLINCRQQWFSVGVFSSSKFPTCDWVVFKLCSHAVVKLRLHSLSSEPVCW